MTKKPPPASSSLPLDTFVTLDSSMVVGKRDFDTVVEADPDVEDPDGVDKADCEPGRLLLSSLGANGRLL